MDSGEAAGAPATTAASSGEKEPPRLTVLIAVRNGARTLQHCLDSVAAQDYPDKELVVVDGASTDGTVAILRENGDKIARWLSEPDRGIYDAWNKGLPLVTGDWLLFLGADDHLWAPDVLSSVAARLVAFPPEIGVAYGQVMLLARDGRPVSAWGEPWERVKPRFGQTGWLPHQAVFQRRSLIARHGPFDASYRIAGDYEWLLRELKTNDARFLPDLIVTGMRLGGLSSDARNLLELFREYGRAQRANGRRRPGFMRVWTGCKVYARLAIWTILGERRARRAIHVGRRLCRLPRYWPVP